MCVLPSQFLIASVSVPMRKEVILMSIFPLQWTLCKRVYCSLDKAIKTRQLFTYFIPMQSVYSDPQDGDESGLAIDYQAQQLMCQHIIDVINSILD